MLGCMMAFVAINMKTKTNKIICMIFIAFAVLIISISSANAACTIATSNDGNYFSPGYYNTSIPAINTTSPVTWLTVNWVASLPSGTSIQIRESTNGGITWSSSWSVPFNISTSPTSSNNISFGVILTSTGGANTPILTKIIVSTKVRLFATQGATVDTCSPIPAGIIFTCIGPFTTKYEQPGSIQPCDSLGNNFTTAYARLNATTYKENNYSDNFAIVKNNGMCSS